MGKVINKETPKIQGINDFLAELEKQAKSVFPIIPVGKNRAIKSHKELINIIINYLQSINLNEKSKEVADLFDLIEINVQEGLAYLKEHPEEDIISLFFPNGQLDFSMELHLAKITVNDDSGFLGMTGKWNVFANNAYNAKLINQLIIPAATYYKDSLIKEVKDTLFELNANENTAPSEIKEDMREKVQLRITPHITDASFDEIISRIENKIGAFNASDKKEEDVTPKTKEQLKIVDKLLGERKILLKKTNKNKEAISGIVNDYIAQESKKAGKSIEIRNALKKIENLQSLQNKLASLFNGSASFKDEEKDIITQQLIIPALQFWRQQLLQSDPVKRELQEHYKIIPTKQAEVLRKLKNINMELSKIISCEESLSTKKIILLNETLEYTKSLIDELVEDESFVSIFVRKAFQKIKSDLALIAEMKDPDIYRLDEKLLKSIAMEAASNNIELNKTTANNFINSMVSQIENIDSDDCLKEYKIDPFDGHEDSSICLLFNKSLENDKILIDSKINDISNFISSLEAKEEFVELMEKCIKDSDTSDKLMHRILEISMLSSEEDRMDEIENMYNSFNEFKETYEELGNLEAYCSSEKFTKDEKGIAKELASFVKDQKIKILNFCIEDPNKQSLESLQNSTQEMMDKYNEHKDDHRERVKHIMACVGKILVTLVVGLISFGQIPKGFIRRKGVNVKDFFFSTNRGQQLKRISNEFKSELNASIKKRLGKPG